VGDQGFFSFYLSFQSSCYLPFVNIEVEGWSTYLGAKGEEETGIASDVVKVLGEDLDTRGYLRGDRLRRDIGDFQSWMRSLGIARDEAPGP